MNGEMRGARANFAAAEGHSVRTEKRLLGREEQDVLAISVVDVAQLAITALTGRQTCEVVRTLGRLSAHFIRNFEVHSPIPLVDMNDCRTGYRSWATGGRADRRGRRRPADGVTTGGMAVDIDGRTQIAFPLRRPPISLP